MVDEFEEELLNKGELDKYQEEMKEVRHEYQNCVGSEELSKHKNPDGFEIKEIKSTNKNLLKMKIRELYEEIELQENAISKHSEIRPRINNFEQQSSDMDGKCVAKLSSCEESNLIINSNEENIPHNTLNPSLKLPDPKLALIPSQILFHETQREPLISRIDCLPNLPSYLEINEKLSFQHQNPKTSLIFSSSQFRIENDQSKIEASEILCMDSSLKESFKNFYCFDFKETARKIEEDFFRRKTSVIPPLNSFNEKSLKKEISETNSHFRTLPQLF